MTADEIKYWLINKIAEESDLLPENVAINVPFESYRLDSLSMITISYELEKEIGKDIDPTVFWQYNSIEELANAIVSLP